MKVIPLADRVLVKPEEGETKSPGGIIIPDSAREKTQQGVIVEIGDPALVTNVKNGQRVMYDKYGGISIKIKGEEYLILKMDDLIAIIE